MLASPQFEEFITVIAVMDRPALVSHIQTYRAAFPVDFTEDFLSEVDLDRLRHIFLALCLHHQQLPDLAASNTAA